MKRKLLILINVLLFSLIIIGCEGFLDNNDDTHSTFANILLSNIEKAETGFSYKTQLLTTDFDSLTVVDSYFTYGLSVVSNLENHKGVWSFRENKLIVPLTPDAFISVVSDEVFGAYIHVTKSSGLKTVYDILGNVVLPEDTYNQASVTGKVEAAEDALAEPVYLETVEYLTESTALLGKDPVNETYQVNIETGERVKVVEKDYNWGDYYNNDNNDKEKLDKLGLKGYYALYKDDFIYVYREEDNRLINVVKKPQANIMGIFSGQLFYQVAYLVNDNVEDYTFTESGLKFQLKTVSISLLTGISRNLNVEYIIESLTTYKNEDGVYNYAYAKIRKISNQVLAAELSYNVIINSRGSIIADVTGFDPDQLIALDDNHILDKTSHQVFDEELNPIFSLPSSYKIVETDKLIVFKHKDFYGAVDYDGKVVIPFTFHTLEADYFYNGRTIGLDSDNRTKIIDLNKNTILLDWYKQTLTNGIYFSSKKNVETNTYIVKIMNYANETLLTLDLVNSNYVKYEVKNAFQDYLIIRFNDINGSVYVVLY